MLFPCQLIMLSNSLITNIISQGACLVENYQLPYTSQFFSNLSPCIKEGDKPKPITPHT